MQSDATTSTTIPDSETIVRDGVKIIEWSGKRIRVFGSDDNPWFHGADLATSLGYKNTNKAIMDNVFSADKCSGSEINKLNPSINFGKYEKQSILLNKRGACSLLSFSKMPNKSGLVELLSSMYGLTYDIIARLGKEQEFIGSIITAFGYCNPERQFKIGSYMIDLYLPTERIAIECDEFNHTQYDQNRESARQEYIVKELGCRFIRFNPDDSNFSIFNVIRDIGSAVLQHHHK